EALSTPPDRVALALASICSGAASGAAIITAGVMILRVLQQSNPRGDAGLLLVLAVFIGIVTAATIAWLLAGRVDDTWRRGVRAALAIFGACMLAGLSARFDGLGDRVGLIVYLLLWVALAGYPRRQARRAARGETLARPSAGST